MKHSKDNIFLAWQQNHQTGDYPDQSCHQYNVTILNRLVGIFSILMMVTALGVMEVQAASGITVGQRILKIELTPALCSMDTSRSRMRQCLEGYSLTVSGLDLGYGNQCSKSKNSQHTLTPLQLHVVNKVMPDMAVRNRAWQTYGACSPMKSSMYFRQIVNHAGQLKLPRELNNGNSYRVSKSRFLQQITHLNPELPTSGIDLICQNGKQHQPVLTEIHICYQGTTFASCPKTVDNCGKDFIISGR